MSGRNIHILGLDFAECGLEPVVAALLARPADEPFGYVVTPNADHFARLRRIPHLGRVYRGALFCLLDSQLIANFAGFLGMQVPPVVTGVALTEALLARLGGQRVAVIGLDRQDFAGLQGRYPQIEFLHHQPPMGLLNDPIGFRKARDFGVAAGAKFLFIALGSPVQELLAHAIVARRSGTGVGVCVGAALEYCAGARKRAPGWMRRAGLEWLYRLGQAPGRLAGRYLLDDPPVFVALIAGALRKRV